MKRRGFLGFMGGAVAAGPSMAKAAVAQASVGMEALSIGGVGSGILYPPEPYYGSVGIQSGGEDYDHGRWLTSELKRLSGMSDDERRDRFDRTQVHQLDSDLASMRSYSLSAKINIQRRRNFENGIDREQRDLKRGLADWLARKATGQ